MKTGSLTLVIYLLVQISFKSLFAQDSFNLHIRIYSASNVPLQSVSVIVMDTTKSTHHMQGITDSSGIVRFKLPPGRSYHMLCTAIGYQALDTMIDLTGNMHVTLRMLPLSKRLGTVSIYDKNNGISIEQDREKFVIQYGPSFVGKGKSIWDLMRMSPLITIRDPDQIEVLNRTDIVVFINGKRNRMPVEALVEYLKSIPASYIKSIEVVPVPTSDYNVSGNPVVINIVYKKMIQNHIRFNSSLALRKAKYLTPGLNINLDYKFNKISSEYYMYGSLSNYGQDFNTDFEIEDKNYARRQESIFHTKNNIPSGLGGSIQYEIDSLQKISINIDYFHSSTNHGNMTMTNYADYYGLYNGIYELDSISNSIIGLFDKQKQFNPEFNYSIKSKNNKNKAYLQSGIVTYRNIDDRNNDFITISNIDTISQDHFVQHLNQNYFGYYAYAKFEHSLKNGNLSIGFNFDQSSNKSYQDIQFLNNTYASYDYLYKENNLQPFFNFESKIHRISLILGSKLRITHLLGYKNDEEIVKKKYFTFLPDLHLNFNLNEFNQFSLAFTSDKNLPKFSDLNPFQVYTSKESTISNNPFLLPSNSYSMLFSYLHKNHLFILSNTYYSKPFNQYAYFNGYSITLIPVNYHSVNKLLITYSKNFSFLKSNIWNCTFNPSVVYYSVKGNDTIYADFHRIYYIIKLQNSFNLTHDLNLSVGFQFFSPDLSFNNYTLYAQNNLYLSLSKTFDKITISLIANDILKKMGWKTKNLNNQNILLINGVYNDSRAIMLRISLNLFKDDLKVHTLHLKNQEILDRL